MIAYCHGFCWDGVNFLNSIWIVFFFFFFWIDTESSVDNIQMLLSSAYRVKDFVSHAALLAQRLGVGHNQDGWPKWTKAIFYTI